MGRGIRDALVLPLLLFSANIGLVITLLLGKFVLRFYNFSYTYETLKSLSPDLIIIIILAYRSFPT